MRCKETSTGCSRQTDGHGSVLPKLGKFLWKRGSPTALTTAIPERHHRETTAPAPCFMAHSGSIKSFSHFPQKQKIPKLMQIEESCLLPRAGRQTTEASAYLWIFFLSSHPKSIQVILYLGSFFSRPGYHPL